MNCTASVGQPLQPCALVSLTAASPLHSARGAVVWNAQRCMCGYICHKCLPTRSCAGTSALASPAIVCRVRFTGPTAEVSVLQMENSDQVDIDGNTFHCDRSPSPSPRASTGCLRQSLEGRRRETAQWPSGALSPELPPVHTACGTLNRLTCCGEFWSPGIRRCHCPAAVPTAFPGIRYRRSSRRVMSATTRSCGTVVALDSADP